MHAGRACCYVYVYRHNHGAGWYQRETRTSEQEIQQCIGFVELGIRSSHRDGTPLRIKAPYVAPPNGLACLPAGLLLLSPTVVGEPTRLVNVESGNRQQNQQTDCGVENVASQAMGRAGLGSSRQVCR
jgi:hypothetical protein